MPEKSPELILYQYPECPFCARVNRAIEDLGLEQKIESRNTRLDREHRNALIQLTGRTQVPCLVVEGKPMLESADIVDYLYREYGRGKKPPRRFWPF